MKKQLGFLRKYRIYFLMACSFLLFQSCSRKFYNPAQKFGKKELEKDFSILKDALQKNHPGIYTYQTPEEFEDNYQKYKKQIIDSLTEFQFSYRVINPFLQKIRCGHTSNIYSKKFSKWYNRTNIASIPIGARYWKDTLMILGNLNKKDTVLKRGHIIKSINGVTANKMVDSFQNYISLDGYAKNFAYARISTNFPTYHRSIYGLSKYYNIEYIDFDGKLKSHKIFLIDTSKKDSISKKDSTQKVKKKRTSRSERLKSLRSMTIDTARSLAYINLNTFSNGHLRRFFRKSFKTIRKNNIQNVAIDLRGNGGGRVTLSTLLTKYTTRKNFRVLDSAIIKRYSLAPYTKYFNYGIFNSMALMLGTKKIDGKRQYYYYIRKQFKPKRNAYDKNLFIITGGYTFSASCLYTNVLKGQPNVTIVGEETGGGWESNNGFLIPKFTLPNTKLRIRFPLVKVNLSNAHNKNGTGILPDILVPPNTKDLINFNDSKMKVIRNIIDGKTQ